MNICEGGNATRGAAERGQCVVGGGVISGSLLFKGTGAQMNSPEKDLWGFILVVF